MSIKTPLQLSDNLYILDSYYLRDERAAVYLLRGKHDRLTLLDVGISSAKERLFEQITQLGFSPQKISSIVLSHAHLDHAGGVGNIANNTDITVYAHADTVRHLCSPEKLELGVISTYGEAFYRRTYGGITALDQARAKIVDDGETFAVDGIEIQTLYTPGHAWHHHSYFIPSEDTVFTGDAFGQSYGLWRDPQKLFIFPSTPPSQFNPAAMRESFDKIVDTKAHSALITHYGQIVNLPECQQQMNELLDQFIKLGQSILQESPNITMPAVITGQADDQNTLQQRWFQFFLTQITQLGFDADLELVKKILPMDASLVSAGVLYYLQKQQQKHNA